MTRTRRRLLGYAAAGAALSLVPRAWTATAAESVRECATQGAFAIPLAVSRERIVLGRETLALRATSQIDALAFVANGLRNPTIVAAAGTTASIDLSNALGEPTTVHWHGLSVDTRNDGNGEAPVAPGATYRYAFPIRNRSALYWYHPHPHGATARQVNRGLFGTFEVEDDEELALRRALGLVVGETQMTLVLQDRRTGDADRYAPAPEDELLGWYGCVPHVNGVLRPYHDVARTAYRLRMLNASNARTYRLAFRDDAGNALPFHLVGTDGGLLEQAARCEELLLSPAERADLVVDFAGLAQGRFVTFETRAFAAMQDVPRAARGGGARTCAGRELAARRRAVRPHAVQGTRVGIANRADAEGTVAAAAGSGKRRGPSAAAWICQGPLAHQRSRVRHGRNRHRGAGRRCGDVAACATTIRAHRMRCTCMASSFA